jgi:site-specific DNA-methyltransferase (adenine-specific)
MSITIRTGDCRDVMAKLPAESVQCCVTSPPYFGLRDYGNAAQIGLEDTPDAYVSEMVAVFREVRRVLRDDGTLWLNLGDSYSTHAAGKVADPMRKSGLAGAGKKTATEANRVASEMSNEMKRGGLPEKNLIGIPWLVAFALRADGWYLRQDIVWAKPNPMPESVTDRCTKSHEYVFLLSKSARYYFDAKAIAATGYRKDPGLKDDFSRDTRNKRSVWPIATQPYSGAHFATMPPELAETCIKAGSKPSDMILDPFGGAGTTALVADRLQRDATIIELNPTYAALARDRIEAEAGLFAMVAAE